MLAMGEFKGTVLSVEDLLGAALAEPEPDWRALGGNLGLVADAADAASHCTRLILQGVGAEDLWRFGILQTLDDYESCRRRGGIELAAQVFDREPGRTGSAGLDAAFAALGAHLAARDGWNLPTWVDDAGRIAPESWYVAPPAYHHWADAETPPEFRARGVFITAHALMRA
jgi:hypothetical protein